MKLKPCPFCGIGEDGRSGVYLCEVKPTKEFYIECGNCGSIGGIRTTEKLACKQWNKRYSE